MVENRGQIWRVACYGDDQRRRFMCYRFVHSENRWKAEKAVRLATGCVCADASPYSPRPDVPAQQPDGFVSPRLD